METAANNEWFATATNGRDYAVHSSLTQQIKNHEVNEDQWQYGPASGSLDTSLEASSGPLKQPMDRPGPQGQQQHTTSWFVEAIRRARSFGGDATVLANYALTTTSLLAR